MRRAALSLVLLTALWQTAGGSARATNIFVSDFGAQAVREYTDAGTWVRDLTIGSLWHPYDLTFGADGMLYAVNNKGNHLEKFDPNTGAYLGAVGNIGAVTPFPTATSSEGVTVGPGGFFYVTTNQNYTFKIDPSMGTNPLGTTLAVPTSGGSTDLAFIPTTTTLLEMAGSRVIYAGGATFATGLANARGMAFGPDGRLYIADRSDFTTGSGHIKVVSAAGGVATDFAITPDPVSGQIDFNYLDFDCAGNLWAASENKIYEFSSSGTFIKTIGQTVGSSHNVNNSFGIAVQRSTAAHVPDSGSVAVMLLSALGIMSLAVRRGWRVA